MENVSTKSEILHDLVELKNKGVKVNMNESYLDRNIYSAMNNGTSFVTGINNVVTGINGINTEIKFNLLKKPSELTVEIYLNSTEDDIKNQIINVKSQVRNIELASKSTAIVDFLKEELSK
jgi:hypothetical protein